MITIITFTPGLIMIMIMITTCTHHHLLVMINMIIVMSMVDYHLYTPPLAPTRQTLGSSRDVANDPARTFQ